MNDESGSSRKTPQPVNAGGEKKLYQKPAFRHERVFETLALACGKIGASVPRCQFSQKDFLMQETPRVRPAWIGTRSAQHWWRTFCARRIAQRRSFGDKTVRLRVHGESMLPTLWPGDVVEIESCSLAGIRPGDIALAYAEGRLSASFRRASLARRFCYSRGFHAGIRPSVFPAEALIGRLVRRVSIHHSVSEQSSETAIEVTPQADLNSGLLVVALSRALGIVFCHFGALRRLALKLHRRRSLWATELRSAIGR